MSKVIGTCDICKREFTAKNEQGLRQTLGFHKRRVHGIVGQFATPAGKRQAARQRHWKKAGHTDEEIIKMEAAFQEKEKRKLAEMPPEEQAAQTRPYVRKKKIQSETLPLGLKECPCCETAFFCRKAGNKDIEPIRLTTCPCCSVRFYVAKDQEV